MDASVARAFGRDNRESPAAGDITDAVEHAAPLFNLVNGDLESFEEASRALFAKDDATLHRLIRRWPADIRKHVRRLIDRAVRLERLAANEETAPAEKASPAP